MKIRNIIIISLLAVVGFVASMVGGMFTKFFGAYGIFVHVSIGSLLCGSIFIAMCRKLKARGTIFIYYTIMGIAYAIIGFIPMTAIMVIGGLIGEILIGNVGNYENNKRIGISYMISELVYALHGFLLLLAFGTEGLAKTFPNLFTLEKARAIKTIFFDPKNMTIIIAIQIVASVLGIILGQYIYKKFFDKSVKKDGILQ